MAGLARRCLVLAVFSCCSLAVALALVVFGNGATWERELPVCASERSACSLIHRRYWQSPLEIRLCRCPRKEPCPEGFETATNASAFNVTARTQLKMCSGWQAPPCNASQVSLVTKTIGKIARVAQGQNGEQTHAEATCRCTGQGSGVHYRRAHGNNSADLTYYEQRQYFTCETSKIESISRHMTNFQWKMSSYIVTISLKALQLEETTLKSNASKKYCSEMAHKAAREG
ncbi:hypothetical protein HPB51_025754 [Rhipicephalus microplus]|uniref:Uncharacterized protein n=1 Tax=Rhipicephalus microplus TaxID=6941 RepID=A0A9J6DDV3_RHIMP|nr:hypothetical protein HPB51_025754 [Rhipicephalus microplus]